MTLTYDPSGDPSTFLDMARLISSGNGVLHVVYIGLFPYTLSFDTLLAAGFNIFHSERLTVFIINIMFDFISVCMIYILSKKITKQRGISVLYSSIYLLNPFCLFYSVLSLPIAAVNALILIVVTAVYALMENMRTEQGKTKIVKYSIVTGISLALLSCFRPISIIFILALFAYFITAGIDKKNKTYFYNSILSFGIISVLYVGGMAVYSGYVHQMTGYSAKSSSGWSLFVGANLRSGGQWNSEDKRLQLQMSDKTNQPMEIHNNMTKLALQRVLSYSHEQRIKLLISKSITLGGSQRDGFENLNSYPAIASRKWVSVSISVIVYTIVLGMLSLVLYGLVKKRGLKVNFLFYVSLVFVALFMASLLVEVSPRYFSSFTPLLIVMIVLLLAENQQTQNKERKQP